LLMNVNYYIPKVSRSQIEIGTYNNAGSVLELHLNPAWVIMLYVEQGFLCQEAASEGSQGK